MAVTLERFNQGMTYDEYKAQMNRNRDRFDQVEARLTVDPAAVDLFKRLPQPLNVLVLAEDWCGDVIANVPIVGKLGQASGKLNIRVFLRDQNDDLMNQYLNQGLYKSIPVFTFFDQNMHELGVFIERPASVTAERARQREVLFKEHPEWGNPATPMGELPEATQQAVQTATLKQRESMFDWANAEVVKELCAIIKPAVK